MKRRLFNSIRGICLVAIFLSAYLGFMEVLRWHAYAFPEYYTDSTRQYIFMGLCLVLCLPMPLLADILISRRCGYRLNRIYLPFLEICTAGKLKLRLTKYPYYGLLLLPPRTDGTSPYRLHLLSTMLFSLTTSVLFSILTALLWNTAAALPSLYLAFFPIGGFCGAAWPRKQDDPLTLLFAFHRHPELRRIWECGLHISASLNEGQRLADMPEAWFPDKPPVLPDNLHVQIHTINGSSRLIQLEQFKEAYALLRPLFDLQPTPDTHAAIAGAILNGAICEAMADLPPMCLSQLDHRSVKYMNLPHWRDRLLTAQYARALFLIHDEREAAALRKEIETAIEKDSVNQSLVCLLEEKANRITINKEAPHEHHLPQ